MPVDRFLHPRAGHSVKVSNLNDLDYRVWTQYLLSADDFGVMRALPLAFQNDNDRLAAARTKDVQRSIDALVSCGLVRTFEHQGKPFLYQPDWQKWQKVEYPRATNHPKPTPDALGTCDAATVELFGKHPGGLRRTRPKDVPNDSGHIRNAHSEDTPTTRETATATANGQRLMANGSEGGLGETNPPFDRWFRALFEAYPPQARGAGPLPEHAFLEVFRREQRDPDEVYAELLAAVENQKQGAQWKAGKVPSLLRWLREGLYTQRHDQIPASTSKQPAWVAHAKAAK